MRNIFLILLTGLLFTSCKKETQPAITGDCENLKQGVLSDNFVLVKTAINNYIEQLSSNLHTQEDLDKLVAYISTKCTNATAFCYNCIFTYPGQSEIIITFNSGGSTIKKVIDITGHPYEKMRFGSMHE